MAVDSNDDWLRPTQLLGHSEMTGMFSCFTAAFFNIRVCNPATACDRLCPQLNWVNLWGHFDSRNGLSIGTKIIDLGGRFLGVVRNV